MQAGDQVAFELVGERRLVAQVIKPAESTYPKAETLSNVPDYSQHKPSQQRKRKMEAACAQHKCQRHYARDAEVRFVTVVQVSSQAP